MDAMDQLRQDVREGRIDAERLLDLLAMQQRQLETALRELKAAQQRIAELEKQAGPPAASGTAKCDQPFSTRSEDKRQQARHPKNKRQLSRKGAAVGSRAAISSSWLSAP